MDKGIIIGVEHEAAARYSLPFVMFRIVTSVCSNALHLIAWQ
jgi:RAB6A-GEF complex partner protein 1